jgi:hypothetical protein
LGGGVETGVVEGFDVVSAIWRDPRRLHGDPLPPGLQGMAVTTDGEKGYVFGGYTGGKRFDLLFSIDPTSLDCRELVPSAGSSSRPGARRDSAIVRHERRLVTWLPPVKSALE